MDLEQLLSRILLALGIGLLIGIERGWRRREAESGRRAAGIRTFAISGLLGGICGAIAQASGGAASTGAGAFLAVSFATYTAVIALFSREENKADETFSATTTIAGMLTFGLGAYALIGDARIAAAAAVATAGVLAVREELHDWVAKLSWSELRSGLVLLAMTFIALPVVPTDLVGPFGGVNLREVWLIAIVLAGVSFVGYAAVKYLGASCGVLLAAAAGGLVSSTAVTVTNARRAAAGEGSSRLLAAGVAIATAVSFVRVLAIAAALQPQLLVLTGPALLIAVVVAIGFAGVLIVWQTADASQPHRVEFRNPFAFWSTLGFAAFLAGTIVLGRVVGEGLGAAGVVIGAVVVGLGDVDSVTVSIARMKPDPLTLRHGAYAILAAVASNTVSKVAIGAAICRGWFAVEIGLMALLCCACAGAALWVTLVLSSV